ncbi:tRNA pseudouridine(38-40) synthase TruA [Pseudotamlana carrageenivorans]|uniref:tRNA pseudouridine synthase A n=1 Tax=Pseudotamlana carrageenivorans TaxID=2069432 RepID=A0A2I7SJQ5_9FLAO|nr:tRNA pseudouridine(38-40) synthase TruA [Tamlana carrageenivorans]AUS06084.1 tRNA pseudouridine(38-40) synthase TruA [Tamlana carrageenivorans]
MRYFLELSYNGKPYHGWQNQPNAISVQEVLAKALTTILGEKISIMGAGRTDAGVHASQMFAHFDSQMAFEKDKFLYKLNSYLPLDIAINDVFRVHDEAHTRFDALSRQYLYRITTKKNVFQYEQSYFVKKPLDVDKMNAASKILFDYEDFQCFSKSNTDVKTYNCEIMKAEWFYKDDELHFVIKANRFLRNMVRAIVGTMVNIGLGKIAVEEMHSIIQSKSRCEAGFSVPAHALFLTHIEYPEDIKK